MHLSGNAFDYIIVFWAGVLVSFTPCVYPLIPITASYIAAANTRGTRWLGFFFSVIYVLGLAIVYCALAVFAGLSGQFFGRLQGHPLSSLLIAVVMLFFGLALLEVFQIPFIGITAQQKIKPRNVWTTLLFGMVSGLVVGPCTAPILGTLLLYVGSQRNLWHGVSLLFVFSYGVGASLILVGTFSGLVSVLPRAGKWMERIKQISGIVLLGAGTYFLFQAFMKFF